MRRSGQGRIETHLKALAQLGEILFNAPSGILTGRIGDGDLDHRCDQKLLDLCHGCPQFHALALAEWREQGTGKGISSLIQLCVFALRTEELRPIPNSPILFTDMPTGATSE